MSDVTTRRAAVLIPLFRGEGGVEIVLTKRAEHLPTHAGQVAFPGGTHDPERDESLFATALREAQEEIGLRPWDAELLGALPAVTTMSSRFEIHPFAARIPKTYEFEPHLGEVAEIFNLPLEAYRDPALRVAHSWTVSGRRVEVPAILYHGHLIWGATLRILDLLSETDVLSRSLA